MSRKSAPNISPAVIKFQTINDFGLNADKKTTPDNSNKYNTKRIFIFLTAYQKDHPFSRCLNRVIAADFSSFLLFIIFYFVWTDIVAFNSGDIYLMVSIFVSCPRNYTGITTFFLRSASLGQLSARGLLRTVR